MHKKVQCLTLENNIKKIIIITQSTSKEIPARINLYKDILLSLPMVYIYNLSVNHLVALTYMLIIYQVFNEAPLLLLSFITGTSQGNYVR